MKTLALVISFVLTSFLSNAQETYSITVSMDNVLNDRGHVLVGLHTAETFMKAKGIQSAKAEIKDGKISVSFTDLEPGEYAIMVVHDENDNERMDMDMNNMPKESYGMSNNPMLYGPPTFNDARFELTKDSEMKIRF